MTRNLLIVTVLLFLLGLSPVARAGSMTLNWAKSIGGVAAESPGAVTTDVYGNIYVTGYFTDTVDFDPGAATYALVARGKMDIFVTKLDAAGQLVWARQMGSPSKDFMELEMGTAIAVDDSGHVWVAGVFTDTADFDPGPGVYNLFSNGGQFDAFAAKLDSAGKFMWASAWGGTDNDMPSALITDAGGNVYLTGNFGNTVDFDPGAGTALLTATFGFGDAYVLKLGPEGKYIWAVQMNADGGHGKDLARDGLGNIYVCGYEQVSAPAGANWWGTGDFLSVWKLDKTGNLVWHYRSDDDDPGNTGSGISLDAYGNLYIGGTFSESVDFVEGSGQLLLNGTGFFDVFVLKMDTANHVIWGKGVTGDIYERCSALSGDTKGNVYITGDFAGTADFDPGAGTDNHTAVYRNGDAYILKLDSSGVYQWIYNISSEGSGNAVCVDQHGTVYNVGQFGLFTPPGMTCDFDPGPAVYNLSSKGKGDAYVLKLICNDTNSFTLRDTACGNYVLNGETYTESGTYLQTLSNRAGCDSLLILELFIPDLNPVIQVSEYTLSTTEPYADYQWYLNGTEIAGATSASYTVQENGDYTVVVTNDRGCRDTSGIYKVNNVSIDEIISSKGPQVTVYPNPTSGPLHIVASEPVDITLSSLEGKLLHITSGIRGISIPGLAAGVYILNVRNKEHKLLRTERIVKWQGGK